MKLRSFSCGIFIILITLCGAAGASIANRELPEDLPPFDVDQWLSGPDRTDFPWKVGVAQELTSQQRNLVTIFAYIPGGKRFPYGTTERDLHFVLKIATADNRWVTGFSHTRIPVPAQLDKSQIVNFSDGVYLRPGSYTIALIVYDPLLKKGNIRRKHINVPRLKKDPLPDLDRDLPEVEFITYDHDLPFPLAKGKEWLPVKNSRGLCIDIVANTSADYDYNPRLGLSSYEGGLSVRKYKAHANSIVILRVSSVLSHLDLRKGKIRVSILDTLRMKTLFDREDASSFDWQLAGKALTQQDHFTIAKNLIGSQTEASSYLSGKLSKILEDDACAPEAESPLKIVIVVSSEMQFAKDTRIGKVIPQDPASVRFIYFPLSYYMKDDLLTMLKPTKPRVYMHPSRQRLRSMLADVIVYLEKLK